MSALVDRATDRVAAGWYVGKYFLRKRGIKIHAKSRGK